MHSLPRPIRYLGYALLFSLWLVLMLLPCVAFALAARGELEWRRSPNETDRIWLIQERDQKGLGYFSERSLSDDSANGGPVCTRTAVRFFLWEGSTEGENTEYCECIESNNSTQPISCP